MINLIRIRATSLGGGNEVEFFVNDLSIAGQFPDVTTFNDAISRIMGMRMLALRYGREVYCHRNIAHAHVTRDMCMQQAIQTFDRDQRQSVMQWLTRQGPFWEDARRHSPDDYFECKGAIVTDSAVAEAAWNCLNRFEHRLVSLTPSHWEYTPIRVDLFKDTGTLDSVDVNNHWDPSTFEDVLRAAPAPLVSWGQIADLARARFTLLTFSANAFAPLNGHPFVLSAAQRIVVILDILNRLKSCFDEKGQRTPAGHEIYRDFFTGKKGDGGVGHFFLIRQTLKRPTIKLI